MTMNGGVSGTLVYMSPQQLTGELASPLDDVYAVGATIYELLTTRPPFYAGDITGQIQRKVPTSMAERRALLKIPEGEIPAKWEAVVAACLAKEPVERPQSALEIALRLGLTEGSATSVPTAAGSLAMARTSGPPSQPVGPATGGHPVISGFTTHYPPPTVAVPASRMPGQSTPLKRIGMTLVAALLLLVGASTVLLFRREKPTPPPAATPPPAKTGGSYGTLLVKTEPAGARVRVGNLPAGPSPYALDKLSPGPQTVQVSADGYEPQTIQVMIEADIFAKPPLIKLARSQGTLRVTSEPDTLPFEMKNRANPLAVTPGVTSSSPIELPSGEYEITVSRDGWPAQTRSVTVRGHEQEAANFQFLTGGLMVTSEPANATIMAGDVDLGETPKEISSLQPGPVSFTLKLKGYDPASVTGTVVAAQVNDLPVTLTKTAPGEKPTEPRPKPRPNDRDDDRDRDRGDRKPGLGHKIKEGFKSLNPFGKKTPTPAPKPKK
jgi:hypothetical protein